MYVLTISKLKTFYREKFANWLRSFMEYTMRSRKGQIFTAPLWAWMWEGVLFSVFLFLLEHPGDVKVEVGDVSVQLEFLPDSAVGVIGPCGFCVDARLFGVEAEGVEAAESDFLVGQIVLLQCADKAGVCDAECLSGGLYERFGLGEHVGQCILHRAVFSAFVRDEFVKQGQALGHKHFGRAVEGLAFFQILPQGLHFLTHPAVSGSILAGFLLGSRFLPCVLLEFCISLYDNDEQENQATYACGNNQYFLAFFFLCL